MKKIILILIMMAVCLTGYSQLNNKIWGLTLGSSTRQQAKNVLQAKGYPFDEFDEGATLGVFLDGGISFGGVTWDFVFLQFYNNTLYSIGFNKEDDGDYWFDVLKEKLDRKYDYYRNTEEIDKVSYRDDDTWIICFYNEENLLRLIYSDTLLMELAMGDEDDEL